MFDENNMTDDTITAAAAAAAAAASTLPCICAPSNNTTTTIDAAIELESETTTNGWDVDWLDGENLAFYLGLLGVFGSIVAYFIQRNYERYQEQQAEQAQLDDLDRHQALERVRMQLSVYIGPLHRLCKSHNTFVLQYRLEHNLGLPHPKNAVQQQREYYDPWIQFLPNDDYLNEFIAQPMSGAAQRYRHEVIHRWKPLYTQIRTLVLNHSSDLADMPTQEEYLARYAEHSIMSPYVGSINIHVIFDTYTVFTYEFDAIIAAWDQHDYTRMQPATKVAWTVCNYIVDFLYDNAKQKQASYNQHVKVHQNTRQSNRNTLAELHRRLLSSDNEEDEDNDNDNDDDEEQDQPRRPSRSRSRKSVRQLSESSTTSSRNNSSPIPLNQLPESPSIEFSLPITTMPPPTTIAHDTS